MLAPPQTPMDSTNRYTAAMFDKNHEDDDYFGFETLVDPDLYDIQVKAYMDKNRCRLQDHMVLVGTYHTRFGRQEAWARPTGLEVEYYHGLPEALELAQVEGLFEKRLYYVPPFSYISTSQSMRMNKERLYGMKVVETVVNVIFLKQGWLVHFEFNSDTDALEAFRYACVNYEPRKMAVEDMAQIKKEKKHKNEVDQARAWGRQNDHWGRGSSLPRANRRDSYSPGRLPSPRVKNEPIDEDSGILQNPRTPSRGSQTQPRFPASVRSIPIPGVSRSPIRHTPAPSTPRCRQPPTYAQTQAYEAELRAQVQTANRAREQDRTQLQQAEERIRELEQVVIAMGAY